MGDWSVQAHDGGMCDGHQDGFLVEDALRVRDRRARYALDGELDACLPGRVEEDLRVRAAPCAPWRQTAARC